MGRVAAAGPVWVVVESRQGVPLREGLEVLHTAGHLAAQLGSNLEALALGVEAAQATALGEHGVATVHLIESGAQDDVEETAAIEAASRLIAEASPALVLYSDAGRGRARAARIAARLGTGLVSGCTRLDLDPDGRLRAQRSVYAGRATATLRCSGPGPAMATLAPGVAASDAPRPRPVVPNVRRVPAAPSSQTRAHVERTWRPAPGEMDLGEAEIIVSGGRGVATERGFGLLTDLARLLGGAVAASRPVIDTGVVPYHRQVGLSGRSVAPRLYIACAISGAPHHVIGVRDADAIIAINRDPHAPIFDLADLGIVADWEQVLPGLIRRLREAGDSVTSMEADAVFGLVSESAGDAS